MDQTSLLSIAQHAALAATVNGRWQPGIGDPTLMGWVTVIGYAVVSLLAVRASVRARKSPQMQSHLRLVIFWAILACLMLFLAINKQLDLQTWFTQVGKQTAKSGGWYEQRRIFQLGFIVAMAMSGACLIGVSCWLVRDALRQLMSAILGMTFTISFVLIRASSFHRIDRFLGWQWGGFKANWILELAGSLCVGLSAWHAGRRPREGDTP